jgi:hypothetical protein
MALLQERLQSIVLHIHKINTTSMNDVLLHLIAYDLRYLVFETCIFALIFISLFLECWYILFWRLSV